MLEIIEVLLTGLLSISLFVFSTFLFRQKGPIPTTFYMLAKPEERKKMRTKEEYRFTGIVMLTLSVIFLLVTLGNLFNLNWTGKGTIILSILLVVYVIGYSIKEISNW
ncbi:DUF3784 domain-containing protein [Serpentinicella sp. ANB-PHB4]|uniref:DUF3784 domain-containing protein n=1 Tax=Serpentinicella sp. ANB-PHB4 TaxID=3074076 RepID=UPI002866960A|nr:DUF3784 domain-containing protein [Serpentinicella sp. ANB-PHB4]MDR5659986.1 DUF3784 domain-containing protein [Serpentinicella sp. ANB-PHB4]